MTADSLIHSSAFPPNPVAALPHKTIFHEFAHVVLGVGKTPLRSLRQKLRAKPMLAYWL